VVYRANPFASTICPAVTPIEAALLTAAAGAVDEFEHPKIATRLDATTSRYIVPFIYPPLQCVFRRTAVDGHTGR
jgi:hypothetical protein